MLMEQPSWRCLSRLSKPSDNCSTGILFGTWLESIYNLLRNIWIFQRSQYPQRIFLGVANVFWNLISIFLSRLAIPLTPSNEFVGWQCTSVGIEFRQNFLFPYFRTSIEIPKVEVSRNYVEFLWIPRYFLYRIPNPTFIPWSMTMYIFTLILILYIHRPEQIIKYKSWTVHAYFYDYGHVCMYMYMDMFMNMITYSTCTYMYSYMDMYMFMNLIIYMYCICT